MQKGDSRVRKKKFNVSQQLAVWKRRDGDRQNNMCKIYNVQLRIEMIYVLY
jgi:hypothetical protein